MAYTSEQKAWLLQQSGYDPEQFDVSDDGFIDPKPAKVSAQPAAMSNGMPQAKLPTPMGAGSTFVKEAIHAAPAAAIGGIGAAAMAALGAAIGAPFAGIGAIPGAAIGGFIGGIGGGLGLGMGASALQAKIEQEVAPEYTAQREANLQAHPLAGMGGRLAALPVGGMNPSLLNVGKAITGKSGHLANVGIGTALGAGIPIGQQLGAGKSLGEALTSPETIEGAIGGAVFNNPNTIGRRMGFHPVNESRIVDPTVVPARLEAMRKELAARQMKGVEGQLQTVPTERQFDFQRAKEELKAETEKVQLAEAKIQHEAAVENLKKTIAQNTLRAAPEQRTAPLVTTETGKDVMPDYTGVQEADNLAVEQDVVGAEQDAIQDQLSRRNQDIVANPDQEALVKTILAAQDQVAATRKATATQRKATKKAEAEAAKQKVKEQAELAKQQAATIKAAQADQERKATLIKTPGQIEAEQALAARGLKNEIDPLSIEEAGQMMATRGVDQKLTPGLNDAGVPVKGTTWVPKEGQPKQRIVTEINPELATLDTAGHEGIGHAFFKFIRDSKHAHILKRYEMLADRSGIITKLNKERVAQGKKPLDFEEFAATEQGWESILRHPKMSEEGNWKQLYRDTVARMKTHLGKGSEAEIRRTIDYMWHNKPNFEKNFGIPKAGTAAKVGTGTRLNSEADDNTKKLEDIRKAGLGEEANVADVEPARQAHGILRDTKNEELLRRNSEADVPTDYRKVLLKKADGSPDEEVYFNDKHYDMGEMGKFASIARMTEKGLSHGATKPGDSIEELPKRLNSEADPEAVRRRNVEPDGRIYYSGNKVIPTPDIVAKIRKDVNLEGRHDHIKTLEKLKQENPDATIDEILSLGYKANKAIAADSRIATWDEAIQEHQQSIKNSEQYLKDIEGAVKKKSTVSPRVQERMDKYAAYEEELNKTPLAERQAAGGKKNVHTPVEQKKPVEMTESRAETVRLLASHGVNATLKRIRGGTDKMPYIPKEHKEDLISDIYTEYAKMGEDSDGTIKTINRIAGKHTRKYLASKGEKKATSIDVVAEKGRELAVENVATVDEGNTVESWKARLQDQIDELQADENLSPDDIADKVEIAQGYIDKLNKMKPGSEVDTEQLFSKFQRRNQDADDERSFMTSSERVLRDVIKGPQTVGQVIATLKNKIPPAEFDMLEKAGLRTAFNKTVVRPDEVVKWIQENGPRAEVVSYGMEGKVSEAKKEYDKMTHEWYEPLNKADRYRLDELLMKQNDTIQVVGARNKNTGTVTSGNLGEIHAMMMDRTGLDYAQHETGYVTKGGRYVGNSEAQNLYGVGDSKNIGKNKLPATLEHISEQNQDKAIRYAELARIVNKEPHDTSPRATSAYSHVSALPTNEPMPDWTATKSGKNVQRVDVVIPLGEHSGKMVEYGGRKYLIKPNAETKPAATGHYDVVKAEPIDAGGTEWIPVQYMKELGEGKRTNYAKWQPDNLHENLPNTLGWAMIQYKTGPKGEKIAVVAEAQSRWGQEVRNYKNEEQRLRGEGKNPQLKYQDHPLLRDYNRLILKAAIEQARKEGATHIVVSDSKSALMTEMLDTQFRGGYARQDMAESAISAGMREEGYKPYEHGGKWYLSKHQGGFDFNYDTAMPKIAEELTGSKGEKVSMGEHKNAYQKNVNDHVNAPTQAEWETMLRNGQIDQQTYNARVVGEYAKNPGKVRDNLIFRNPDGTPKTDVSGMMFELPAKRTEPFSYFERRNAEADDRLKSNTKTAKDVNLLRDVQDVYMRSKPVHEIHNEIDAERITGRKVEQTESKSGNWSYWPEIHKVLNEHFPSPEYRIEAHDGTVYVYNDEATYNILKAERDFERRNQDADEALHVPGIMPEVEKLRKISPVAGAGAHDFLTKFRGNVGAFEQTLIRDINKARPYDLSVQGLKDWARQDNADNQAVVKYRNAKQDGDEPGFELTPVQQKINEAVEANLLLTHTEREAREGLATGKGQKEHYLPAVMNREATHTIAEKMDSAAFKKYREDFVEYRTSPKRLEPQTEEGALEDWKTIRGGFTLQQKADRASQFGAIDKAMGKGLPVSMRETNLQDLMSRFNKRNARRIAYYDAIESKPEVTGAFFDKEQGVGSTAVGKNVVEDIFGIRDYEEGLRNAASGLVRAGMMGTLTGAKDVLSGQVLGLQHMGLDQVLPAKIESLKNWRSNYERAIKSGVIRHSTRTLESGDTGQAKIHQILGRAADIMNVAQGRTLLENVSRTLNFGEGVSLTHDALVALNKGQLTGVRREFLENFMPDWKNYKNGDVPESAISEAAARYVESVQGGYDLRGLPSITQKGSLALPLSLARWNIEKFNNFTKHVVTPATKGNYRPLLMSTVGMLIGGAAVNALVEEITGRKSRVPSFKEASESKDAVQMLGYKLAALASMSGYTGVMGDVTMAGLNYHYGNKVQTWSNPLLSGLGTVAEEMGFLTEALASGDLPKATDVISMILSDHLQAYRLAEANLSSKKKERVEETNKRRDLKVYEMGEGLAVAGSEAKRPNPLIDKDAREFKQTDDMQKAMELIGPLIQQAIEKSEGNPERLKEELSKLKRNSYQTVPSPERSPMKFAGYTDWMNRTQGQDETQKRITDYMIRNAKNKAKSSMVPSL
jgi:hypothetical protein